MKNRTCSLNVYETSYIFLFPPRLAYKKDGSPEKLPSADSLDKTLWGFLEALVLHKRNQIANAIGIAPFVIVPSDHFGEIAVLDG